ncbi:MAG: AAA family ATPase [Paludibacter sp.]|nr:AAA family ATPase [Paludibacter sp.]
MHISDIKITNYRSLKNFNINLDEKFSLIIGKNNTGKTSFISLLDTFVNEKQFLFNDFNLEFQNIIKQTITENLSQEQYIEQSLSLELVINYDENDNLSNFSNLILDLDPNIKTIHIKFSYYLRYEAYKQLCNDFQAFSAEIIKKGLDVADERYSLINFLKKNFKKYFFVKILSVEHQNDNNFIEIKTKDIKQILTLRTIKATREVSNDIGTQKLSQLSCRYFNASEEVEDAKRDLQIQLMDADKSLDAIYEQIFSTIKDSFNKFTNGKPDLAVKSSLKEYNLLENNTQILYDQGIGVLPEEFNGLGYMNFFAILFDLHIQLRDIYNACIENEGKAILNLLFIEEPEVHTHPQMQYIFIKNILGLLENEIKKGITNLQTIITTHSAHIVSQCDFKHIKYFVNTGNNIEARNLNSLQNSISKNVSVGTPKENEEEIKRRFDFLCRYLTLSTAEIFFADKVIFIEGTTERILLSEFIKKIDIKNKGNTDYRPLASQHISIVETGAYAHIFKELIEFLGVKVLVITDIDSISSANNRKKVKVQNSLADKTSNSSIINFLGTDNLTDIINKTTIEKTLDNKIRLAYQTEYSGYHARSFEDAFICRNYEYIKNNATIFNSLISKDKINDTPDYYQIAEECIGSKSGFACDLLYYDRNWIIPEYIQEGLEWLAQ